jgi:RecG-like helicase
LASSITPNSSTWLAGLGIRWSGCQEPPQRQRKSCETASGAAHIAIGTHALFQDAVEFSRLGLAIVDEQHRFGVRQRCAAAQRLTAGSTAQPHQLMMSATPIPRTLAMSYYADLDVSVIDELPPGRSPIATRLVADKRRDEVIQRIRETRSGLKHLGMPADRRVEVLQLQTALDTHARLQCTFRTHGRAGARALADGRETGGDAGVQERRDSAPGRHQRHRSRRRCFNATLMVIDAERMGLAQPYSCAAGSVRGGREHLHPALSAAVVRARASA